MKNSSCLAGASHRHWVERFIQLCFGDLTAFNVAKFNGRLANGDLIVDGVLGDLRCSFVTNDLIQWGHDRWGSTGKERSEEHTSELQSRGHLVCRLLLEKKKKITNV